MTITLNERQIKALRALKQTGSYIAQYRDSAGWYVWIPKPHENDTVKVYKARLNLTCRDVHQMSHMGLGFLSEPTSGSSYRYLTDKGRQYLFGGTKMTLREALEQLSDVSLEVIMQEHIDWEENLSIPDDAHLRAFAKNYLGGR